MKKAWTWGVATMSFITLMTISRWRRSICMGARKTGEGKRADVAQGCVKMSGHKDKWYEPYKIVTSLDKTEIARRIESKTAFIASRYDGSIDDLLFYSAKKYDGEYRGYISQRKIPPSSRQQVFLPKAIIEIFTNSEGKSCVFIRLKKTIFSWVGYCVFFLTLGYTNAFIYILFQCLAVFLLMKYWEFVRRCVGKLLEELLEAEKETEE